MKIMLDFLLVWVYTDIRNKGTAQKGEHHEGIRI
jgi:hypothetical protein